MAQPKKNSTNKAQIMTEYIILVVAVLTVVIMLVFSPGSPFRPVMNSILNSPVPLLNAADNEIQI